VKRIYVLIAVALMLLVASGVALAKSDYQASFKSAYPAAAGSALDNCNLCHAGLPGLNKYGTDWAAAGRDFKAIEGKDSDGDGATNLAEIQALTSPGDAGSKPAAKPAGATAPSQPAAPSALQQLADKGIVKGSRPGYLGSSSKVTRAEMATFIARIAGLPKTFPVKGSFSDVPAWAWYYPFVEVSVRAGFMAGNADGTFKPGGTVSGAEALQIAETLGVKVEDAALAARTALTRGEVAGLLLKLYEKKGELQTANYFVGPEACQACHAQAYKDWKSSMHSRMVLDINTPGATNANFAAQDKFSAADVKYVVGGLTSNYFVGKDYKYLPLGWDIEHKQWKPRNVSPWLDACTGCHTTGYNKNLNMSFVALGITCESCHGAGAKHVAAAGDKSLISASVGNDACDSCHGSGRQGEQLKQMSHTTVFKEVSEARGEQYWKSGCFRCHSAAYKVAELKGKPVPKAEDYLTGALKDDRLGITCAVCHDPHKNTGHEAQLRKDINETCMQCHQNSRQPVTAGTETHHSQRESFAGVLFKGDGTTETIPSPKAGITCADCHMTNGNHFFKVGTPELTLNVKGKDVVFNSCGKCHTSMTADEIKEVQEKYEAKYEALKKQLDELKARYDKAGDSTKARAKPYVDAITTDLAMFHSDGSQGIHNTKFFDRVFVQVEKDLASLKQILY